MLKFIKQIKRHLLFCIVFSLFWTTKSQFLEINLETRNLKNKNEIFSRVNSKLVSNFEIVDFIQKSDVYYITIMYNKATPHKLSQWESPIDGGFLLKVNLKNEIIGSIQLPSSYQGYSIKHEKLVWRGTDSLAIIFSEFNTTDNIQYYFYKDIINMKFSDSTFLLDQFFSIPKDFKAFNGVITDKNHQKFALYYLDVSPERQGANLAVKVYDKNFEVVAADPALMEFEEDVGPLEVYLNIRGTLFLVNYILVNGTKKVRHIYSLSENGTFVFENDSLRAFQNHIIEFDLKGNFHLLMPVEKSTSVVNFRWIILDCDSGFIKQNKVFSIVGNSMGGSPSLNAKINIGNLLPKAQKYNLLENEDKNSNLNVDKNPTNSGMGQKFENSMNPQKDNFKKEKINLFSCKFSFSAISEESIYIFAELEESIILHPVSRGYYHSSYAAYKYGPIYLYNITKESSNWLKGELDFSDTTLNYSTLPLYYTWINNSEILLVAGTGLSLFRISKDAIYWMNSNINFNQKLIQGSLFILPQAVLLLEAAPKKQFRIQGYILK